MKKSIVILITALTITASSAAVASADTNYVPNFRPQATSYVHSNQDKVQQQLAQLKGLISKPQSNRQIQDQIKQLEDQIKSLIDQDNNYNNYPLSIRNDIDNLRSKGHFSNWQPGSQNIAQFNQNKVEQLLAQLKGLINQPQSNMQIQDQIRQLEAQIQSLIDQDNNYNNYPLSIRNDIDNLRSKGHFSNWNPNSNNKDLHQNGNKQDDHTQNGHDQKGNK